MQGDAYRSGSLRRTSLVVAATVGIAIALGGCGSGVVAPAPTPAGVSVPEFVGYTTIPPGQDRAAPLGGLSGLAWDAATETLYAVSDNKGAYGPPRIYRLGLAFSPAGAPEVRVEGWIPLAPPPGSSRSMDPEGVALAAGGGFYVSSEGWVERSLDPFVARYDAEGRYLESLPLPEIFRIGPAHGPRQNKVFEGLASDPSGRYLFIATESGLIQDAPDAGLATGSIVRILRWDLQERRWAGQFGYPTDPVHAMPTPAGALATSGLTDLLVVDEETLLVVERSFSQGPGFRAALYRVSLTGAQDLSDRTGDLGALPAAAFARKELLVEFARAGIPLDNYEGITFGPRLPDGRRSLLVVSDDNFDPRAQSTFLVVFAWPE